MYKCIDSNNLIYSTEEYCLLKKAKKHPKHIYCPFCNNKVFIRGENSKEKTHFMHSGGTSCSITNYKKLFSSNGVKKSPNEILSLKFSIFSFSYDIFMHIQSKFNIVITPQEFTNILKKIVDKKVLELLDITPEIIPYICINELGRYNNTLFLYTNSSNKNIDKLWNMSSKKDIILCVNKNNDNTIKRSTIQIDNNFLQNPIESIPLHFIDNIVPEIFNSLGIDQCYEDLLLKYLLSQV